MIKARFALRYARTSHAALDLNVELPGQGVTAVFGPSGAGKSSLLRCLAGLERPQGELSVLGQCWQDQHHFLPVHKRPLAYVFQDPGLFPHLNVAGNLAFARRRAWSDAPEVDDVVAMMDLQALLHRWPGQLSGGERQRVAIARAVLLRPRLLLMDEPLAALDATRKREILPYLERLHAAMAMPIIYVSHSLDEVARLADHLLVLESGRVVAQGDAADLLPGLQAPGEEQGVLLQAKVSQRDENWQLIRLAFAGGSLWAADDGAALGAFVRLRVLARDVSISLDAEARSSILNRLPATVHAIENLADTAQALVTLDLGRHDGQGASRLLARLTRRSVAELQLRPGQSVWAQLKSVAVVR